MEWEKEKCLQLIDEYEKHELLWNPGHGSYYDKLKKSEAWFIISRAVGCSTDKAKKKMESLLASYRRERSKGRKAIETGKCGQEYIPKWFAFNRMSFLKNREPRGTGDSDNENGSSGQGWEHYEAAEIITELTGSLCNQLAAPDSELTSVTTSAPVLTTPTPVTHVVTNTIPAAPPSSAEKPWPRRKRKIPEGEARIDDALDILKHAVTRSSLEDECGHFGQYVANKLRAYDRRTRATAQHDINNILFNADMKCHH